jgi:hypothetical protein
VRDVHGKFVRLAELEAAGWTEEEETVEAGRRESVGPGRGRAGARAAPSPALRALIAQRRREAAGGAEPAAVKVVISRNNDSDDNRDDDKGDINKAPERTFDGGFFSISSPAAAKLGSAAGLLGTRSAGRPPRGPPRRAALTDSARRTACLLSPFISQFAKLGLSRWVDSRGRLVGDSALARKDLEIPAFRVELTEAEPPASTAAPSAGEWHE